MNRYFLLAAALSILSLGFFGCSSNPGNPLTPDLSVQDAVRSESNVHLWGWYEVRIDPETHEVLVNLDRSAMFTANVTNFLNNSASGIKILIQGTDPEATYTDVDVDVTLTHPFPGLDQYNGYDVRGVFMGDGSANLAYNTDLAYPVLGTDQFMLPDPIDGHGGPDGYTRWYNRTEFSGGGMPLFQYTQGKAASPGFDGTATLCPYRYFADDLKTNDDAFDFLASTDMHGVFSAGQANTRNYYLRFPTAKGIKFGYAVIANWDGVDVHPSNAVEALSVRAESTDNIWYVDETQNGGSLILDLDIFAWNTAPDISGVMKDYRIFIESTVLSAPYGLNDSEMTPTGGNTYSTYHVEIPADNITGIDGNEYWVIVESADADYTNPFGVSNLADTDPLAACFRAELTVLNTQANVAPDVTGIEDVQGSGSYAHTVKIDAVKTYWAIFTDPNIGQTHTFTWYIVNDGASPTPADIVTFPFDWSTKGIGDYDIYVDVSDGIDTTQGGPYDINVIDKSGDVITWGGSGTQYLLGFGVDHQGAKVSGGYFFGNINLDPEGNDPHEQVSTGMEMWLNKINTDGTEAWGYTWAGSMDGYHSYIWGITFDAQDNVYVCGHFVGTIDFDPGAGVDIHTASNNSGRLDAYLMKFNANGDYLWGESWGNAYENVTAFDIVNYNDEYLYLTGYYPSGADIDPTDGEDIRDANSDTGLYNEDNAYMIKVDLDGNYIWGRVWGWSATLYGYEVTVDGDGNPIATGDIEGTGDLDPTGGVQSYTSNGWSDTYIIKFLADGTWQWSRAFGGDSWDINNALVADSNGNVYYCGGTCSTSCDFDPGAGDATKVGMGSYDGYLVKLDSSGIFQWVGKFGGSDHDNTWALTMDSSGDLLMGGHFSSTADLDPTAGVDNHSSAGSSDSYCVKIHQDGTYGWGASWGGPSYESPEGIGLEPDGMIDVGGNYDGTTDFDPGAGVHEHSSSGGYDSYINMLLPGGTW